jgi:hypothetical protein
MPAPHPNRGVLTIASGSDEYVMLAGALLKSLRLNAPGVAVAVVTDRRDHPVISRFDHVVDLDTGHGGGFAQKLHLPDYAPYEETMYVDADCLAYGPLDELWQRFADVPSVGVIARRTPTPFWCTDIERLPSEYQLPSYVEFNGGLYFLRRGEATDELFAEARSLFERSESLALVRFGETYGDEPAMALALSRANVGIVDDAGRGMRTPSALTGTVTLDVAGQRAQFIKWGSPVAPVLVHFAGGRWRRPVYRRELLAMRLAARGVPRPVASAVARMAHGSLTAPGDLSPMS